MGHTPGPWEYSRMRLPPKEKDRRCGFVVNGPDVSDDLPVRVCDLRCPVGVDGFSEGEANARLIAAAPDLLAALQYIAGWQPENWNPETARDMARAAIAKAEGRD